MESITTTDLEQELERAREDAEEGIVLLTANLLRMMRGRGKPYQLASQLRRVNDAMQRHWELSRTWPSRDILNAIRRPRPSYNNALAVAEEMVISGALQVAASDLLDQRAQSASGVRQLRDGIREFEWVMSERRRRNGTITTTSDDDDGFAEWAAKHGLDAG